jgi:cytochrome b
MITVTAAAGFNEPHTLAIRIWHWLLGYGIAGLVLVRIILELSQPDEEKLRIKIRGPIKSVHNFTQYLVYGFILFHLAGVTRADSRRHPGLVSGMINGKKGA